MSQSLRFYVWFYILLLAGIPLPVHSSKLLEKEEPYIKLTSHNIGQGNCITAELNDPSEEAYKDGPIYMLFDAGSSAYDRELLYYEYFMKKAEELKITQIPEKKLAALSEQEITSDTIVSPPQLPRVRPIPDTVTKAASPKAQKTVKQKMKEKEGVKKVRRDIAKDSKVKEIRLALGFKPQKRGPSPMHVKLFGVSHSDEDHYGWGPSIFKNEDHLENIILGGLPENYGENFRSWLQERIELGTRVYFPALQYTPLASLKSILLKEAGGEAGKSERTYKPHIYFNPKQGLDVFKDILPYGKHIRTFFLSVNPTHCMVEKDIVQRMCTPEDHNSDSMVIRLEINQHSALIMGDATSITTNRLLIAYADNPQLIRTSLIIASHHGASREGCNDKEWIRATECQYAIFSCGALHGHPSREAYKNFKEYGKLSYVEQHEVWVWGSRGGEIIVHPTYRGIFSTFNSGTLAAILPAQGKIQIESKIVKPQEEGVTKTYENLKLPSKRRASLIEKELLISVPEEELKALDKSLEIEEETESSLMPSSSSPYVASIAQPKRLQYIKGKKGAILFNLPLEIEKGKKRKERMPEKKEKQPSFKRQRIQEEEKGAKAQKDVSVKENKGKSTSSLGSASGKEGDIKEEPAKTGKGKEKKDTSKRKRGNEEALPQEEKKEEGGKVEVEVKKKKGDVKAKKPRTPKKSSGRGRGRGKRGGK